MQGPGTYKLTIRVIDNGTPELSDEQTMSVRVNEVNKAPVARDSSADVDEDATVSITVSAADADLPANNLTYTLVGAPANGTVSVNGSTITYRPNEDFNGSDTFTFKANDGTIDSNAARIRIEVKTVNDDPVAIDDAATSDATPIEVKVLENDKDIDGDRLTLTRVGASNGGKAEISGEVIRFTPDKDFAGTVTVEYEVSDNKGGTAKGRLRITVNAVKPN
jgi:hypothetical protein